MNKGRLNNLILHQVYHSQDSWTQAVRFKKQTIPPNQNQSPTNDTPLPSSLSLPMKSVTDTSHAIYELYNSLNMKRGKKQN